MAKMTSGRTSLSHWCSSGSVTLSASSHGTYRNAVPDFDRIALALLLLICSSMTRYRSDVWIRYGLSGHLNHLFYRKMFGNNEYKWRLLKVAWRSVEPLTLPIAVPVRNSCGSLTLTRQQLNEWICANDTGKPPLHHTNYLHPIECCTKFARHKAAFVVYMLEKRLGSETFQKVRLHECDDVESYR